MVETGTVLHDRHGAVEVTTFRNDVSGDGRHATIAYARSIEADLERRDFTISAMALNQAGKLADPHNGRTDTQSRTLRFVGDPSERIRKDYLRIIRVYRFKSHYALTLDNASRAAMQQHTEDVPERVNSSADLAPPAGSAPATLSLSLVAAAVAVLLDARADWAGRIAAWCASRFPSGSPPPLARVVT